MKKRILSFLLLLGLLALPALVCAETVSLVNPLTGTTDAPSVPEMTKTLITSVVGLSGVMAMIAFIYGGVLFLMASFNPDFVKKGKEIMKWAVVGLVVIFGSYALINFVLTNILGLS